MISLEWKECEESGYLKAQGAQCEYWIYETTRNHFILWRKPNCENEGGKEWEGSNICCAQHADIMEANKHIVRCHAAMRETQELLKDGAEGAITDTVWCKNRVNTTLWEWLDLIISEG